MDKNYYPEYFELERSNWWFKARMRILQSQVEQLIPAGERPRILNIGAATGATSQMLSQYGDVVSIEYDSDCVKFVNDKTNLNLQQGNILDLQFDAHQFDIVCAFDVVEHVADDNKAVSEMLRVCKTGGYVFVSVPAFQFLWSEHDEINHHFKRYTHKKLKQLFNKSNIVYMTYFNSLLFFPIAFVRLISKWIPLKRKGSGSDFGLINQPVLNQLFYILFLFENVWLKRKMSVPFGVSLMLVGRKL